MTAAVKTTGRGWAYTGAILGGAVSVAANVAHSYVPPTGAPAHWAPQPGAVVGAVFWPVFLFIAVEILARYAWPAGFRWVAVRYLGMLPVAVVAAVVSYRHLSGLLRFYGEDRLTVAIGPLAVDGLMVMATGALIATGARRAAIAVTLTEATRPTPDAAGEAAQPAPAVAPAPVAPPSPVVAHDAAPAPAPQDKPKPARASKRQPSAADRVARAVAKTPNATPAQIAARLKLSERTVQRHMPRPADDSVSSDPVTPSLSAVA